MAYTKSFVEITLPSLLAPGNIPALQDVSGTVYNIFTTEEDRQTIEASAAYRRLVRFMSVVFHSVRAIRDRIENQYTVQSDCYRRGIRLADTVNAAMLFINADIVVANGGLSSVVTLVQRGKRAVMALGFRVDRSVMSATLVKRHRSEDESVISIEPRELVALAIPNLHAISKSHMVHGEGEDLHPAGLFWRVGSDGLLAHCFHLHPVIVHPEKKNASFSTTIDADYLNSACPNEEDICVIDDSDQFCACELSEADRRVGGLPRTGATTDISRWAYTDANRRHREFVQIPIRIHGSEINPAIWAPVEREADNLVRQVLVDLGDRQLMATPNAAGHPGTGSAPRHLPLRFFTPVWGIEQCEAFVTVTLRSILSLGNIPAVPNKHECSYTIFTDVAGRAAIESSEAYSILREQIRTEFLVLDGDLADVRGVWSSCHRKIIEHAARDSAAAVFLIPEAIVADGSLHFLANALRTGVRQVLTSSIHLVKNAVIPPLLDWHLAGGIITISGRELARLALSNVNPIAESSLFDGDGEYLNPASLYWRAGDQGLVVRSFHFHPIAVVPKREGGDLDPFMANDFLEPSSYGDKEIYVVTDSDEFLWCEIGQPQQASLTLRQEGNHGIVNWMVDNAGAFQRSLMYYVVRVHAASCSGPEWQVAEARSDAYAQAIHRLYEARTSEQIRTEIRTTLTKLRNNLAVARIHTLHIGARLLRLAVWRVRRPIVDTNLPGSVLSYCAAILLVVVLLPFRILARIRRRLARGSPVQQTGPQVHLANARPLDSHGTGPRHS